MQQEEESTKKPTSTAIYYFGYGPTVNPMVRSRRRLKTCEERPAILPEFRLTFAYGGIANMVRQRGYEVHGILMKFTSEEDWKRFQKYDAGYNDSDLVQVIPYGAGEEDEPIQAYALSMNEYDTSKLEAPIEQLPTERYLKLIANGMRSYKLDEDYIQDQIMSVAYVPSPKPEEYMSIPQASDSLPKITFAKYQKLCHRSKDIYFIINDKVCRLGPHDPQHPAVIWLRERVHGQRDSTLVIHQTIVEPDLPLANTLDELTPLHHAWAEHHTIEYLRKCNLTATKVYDLVPEEGYWALRFGSSFRLWCFSGNRHQGGTSNSEDGTGPLRSARRRSTRLRSGHGDTLVSSELLHREIRRHAGDGGDTDADEESSSETKDTA
jgi:hypothetical protein